jgi:hypothetical protein
MKEPQRIKMDPSTPTQKDVNKIPMPPVYKPEWDITGQNNDDVYTPLDLDKINKVLDESSDENTENCN